MGALCAVVVLFLWGLGFSGAAISDESHDIILKSRIVSPPPGMDARVSMPDGSRYGIVQFYDVPSAELRAALAQTGLILHQYVPRNSWLATFPEDVGELVRVSEIRWVGVLDSADKVDAYTLSQLSQSPAATVDLWVNLFPDVTGSAAQQLLTSFGLASATSVTTDNTYLVTTPGSQLNALLAEDSIIWVTLAPGTPQTTNDGIRSALGVDAVHAAPYDLDGSGVQIAIFDDGLVDVIHPDFDTRVIHTSGSMVSNHSTHVAGILAGSGVNSELHGGTPGQWGGVAPGSELISYQLADPIGPHNEAINTFGAEVSQNSWGLAMCQIIGEYQWYAASYDGITTGVYGTPISVVFSAGNHRTSCGQTYGTVLGGAQSAKNVITVGAVNDDGSHSGSASGWGPTLDGRIKPELVSPGVSILSTRPGGGYGDYTGSSQSAPAISGTIALLQQHYRQVCEGHIGTDDAMLPATVRAILTHSATDLDTVGPDYSTGFGMVDVQQAVRTLPTHIENSIANGTTEVFTVSVAPGESTLKFTLAWDDVPPSVLGGAVLVNELDLELEAPDGTIYGPWLLDPTAGNEANPAVRPIWMSGDAPQRDDLNVIEQVLVDNPLAGEWQVRVIGEHVPEGPQSYALVGQGLTTASCAYLDQPSVIAVVSPEEDAFAEGEVPVVVSAMDLEDGTGDLQVEMAVDAGEWEVLSYDSATEHYETMWDTTGMIPGAVDLDVRVIDSADNEVFSTVSVIVRGDPTGVSVQRVAVQPPVARTTWWVLPLLALFSVTGLHFTDRIGLFRIRDRVIQHVMCAVASIRYNRRSTWQLNRPK